MNWNEQVTSFVDVMESNISELLIYREMNIDIRNPIRPIPLYGESIHCNCSTKCDSRYCVCVREGQPCGPKCRCSQDCCVNKSYKSKTKEFICSCRKGCLRKYCVCFRHGVHCGHTCSCIGVCENSLDNNDINLLLDL